MKRLTRYITIFFVSVFCFFMFGEKASAQNEHFILTLIFYDDISEVQKFREECLKYEFKNINDGKGIIGFDEKIENKNSEFDMNTIHNPNTTKTIVKFEFIDINKLGTMTPQELENLKHLLEISMAGIIFFDYSDPKLDVFQGFWASGDCEAFLKYDAPFNSVFRFMRDVKWANFVGVHIYNTQKMTKDQQEKRYSALENYMGTLERFFQVDNRWNTRNQCENFRSVFSTVALSGSGELGSAAELIRNEPLVIKHIKGGPEQASEDNSMSEETTTEDPVKRGSTPADASESGDYGTSEIDEILASERISRDIKTIIENMHKEGLHDEEKIDEAIAKILQPNRKWPPKEYTESSDTSPLLGWEIISRSSESSRSSNRPSTPIDETYILPPMAREAINKCVKQMQKNGYTPEQMEDAISRRLQAEVSPRQGWLRSQWEFFKGAIWDPIYGFVKSSVSCFRPQVD